MKHRTSHSAVTIGALGAIAFGALLISSTPSRAQQQMASAEQSTSSVYDVLGNDPRFSTTMKMVYVAGAATRLQTSGPVTVFAPTDAGWDNSSYSGLLSSLSSTGASTEFPEGGQITKILRGFFVRGEPTKGGSGEIRMQSVASRPIEFDAASMTVQWVDSEGVTHSAHVAGQPILATNGVIYPVDAVVGG